MLMYFDIVSESPSLHDPPRQPHFDELFELPFRSFLCRLSAALAVPPMTALRRAADGPLLAESSNQRRKERATQHELNAESGILAPSRVMTQPAGLLR
jgi:hypothetical protein